MKKLQNFHDYFFGLPMKDRELYCKKVNATMSYIERVAGGFRLPSFSMASLLVAASKGKVSYESIIETWENRHGKIKPEL